MGSNSDRTKTPEPKISAKHDLKSLPMPEIRNWKWGHPK
jgi:hypothetical protein